MNRCSTAVRRARAAVLAVAWLLAIGCSREANRDPWTGRWSRQVGEATSTLSLWEEDGRRLACWSRRGAPTGESVRCARGGASEVVSAGQVVYVYRSSVVALPDGALQLEVEGTPAPGAPGSPIRWKDRLTLQADGRELWSQGVELNDVPRDPPSTAVRFGKVADRPF